MPRSVTSSGMAAESGRWREGLVALASARSWSVRASSCNDRSSAANAPRRSSAVHVGVHRAASAVMADHWTVRDSTRRSVSRPETLPRLENFLDEIRRRGRDALRPGRCRLRRDGQRPMAIDGRGERGRPSSAGTCDGTRCCRASRAHDSRRCACEPMRRRDSGVVVGHVVSVQAWVRQRGRPASSVVVAGWSTHRRTSRAR